VQFEGNVRTDQQKISTKQEEGMKTKRSKMLTKACFLFMGLFLIGSYSTVAHAAGSGYPDKTISIIVPFPAGGVTDLSARILAEAMEKLFKQPVVVVNKPGGAMTIGGNAVATAKPDGYTLGFLGASGIVPEVFTYFYSAPYSSNDLRPICQVATFPLTITVKGDAPWNSLKELIDFARKNPGMKFGHNGRSNLQYVVMTNIAKTEKVKLVDVPYGGDAKQIPALLGGHIPIITSGFTSIQSLWEAKQVKILALIIEKRVDFAPDIPTVVEFGYKLPFVGSFSLLGPKGTPDEVVRKLNEVVHKITEDKDFQDKSKKLNLQVAYQDAASFEKSLIQLKENLQTFFKEEGLVK
jgi:tripartite-type tricarboxylate transporter receptor subunit TctC